MTTASRIDLVRHRVNRGLSIRAAAKEMGIAEQSLRRAEGGDSVQPRVAFAIASFYGQKVTDLWPLEAVVPGPVPSNGEAA